MADEAIPSMQVNHTPNVKAPITPVTRLSVGGTRLEWNPIEYIACYKVLYNGKEVAQTRQTRYDIAASGEWQVVGISSEGVSSFASEPLYAGTEMQVEIPGEGTAMSSAEISYRPETPVCGYSGEGFAETDHKRPVIEIPVEIAEAGEYALCVRYANGNGPVNTENKSAVRTLSVDGVDAGMVVMPQRGVANWDDWGLSNSIRVTLPQGRHVLRLTLRDCDENMNLHTNHALVDAVLLRRY